MTALATVCPHCREDLGGHSKPHCRDDKGDTRIICGWLVHQCGATVDPRHGTHSCGKHPAACKELR